ncbi:MAG: DUF3151 domain-containing protein [Candidatus Dormiibacterota bacterium]
MSSEQDPPRPLTSVPVAPHSHQIQAAHRTVLPEEDPAAVTQLAEILAPARGAPGADRSELLRQLCANYPSFLDGWARLAEAAYSGADPVGAYAFARVGYHRGLDRLRRHGWGGSGQVQWAEPTNRGFLRSLYMLMLAAAAIGEDEEASRCRQFLLDLDPNDGLGVARLGPLSNDQMVGVDQLP